MITRVPSAKRASAVTTVALEAFEHRPGDIETQRTLGILGGNQRHLPLTAHGMLQRASAADASKEVAIALRLHMRTGICQIAASIVSKISK